LPSTQPFNLVVAFGKWQTKSKKTPTRRYGELTSGRGSWKAAWTKEIGSISSACWSSHRCSVCSRWSRPSTAWTSSAKPLFDPLEILRKLVERRTEFIVVREELLRQQRKLEPQGTTRLNPRISPEVGPSTKCHRQSPRPARREDVAPPQRLAPAYRRRGAGPSPLFLKSRGRMASKMSNPRGARRRTHGNCSGPAVL
jgi:hypothetical protein